MLVDISRIRSFAEVSQIVQSCSTVNDECSKKISTWRKTSLSVARRAGTGSRPGVAPRNNTVTARPAKVKGTNGVVEMDIGRNVSDDLVRQGASITPTTKVAIPFGKQAGTGPVRLEDFKAPPKTQVALYTATISKLHDNLNTLADTIALMKQAFSDNKKQPAAVRAAVDLYNDATRLSNDAYEMLNEMAEKHQPPALVEVVDKVFAHLKKIVPEKNYTDSTVHTYCAIKDGEFYFCNYFEFTELKNSKGFSYPAFFIIVTGVIDPRDKLLRLYTTSLTDFRPPASFPLGQEASNFEGVKKRLLGILAGNDLSAFNKLPMSDHSGVEAIAGVGSKSIKDDVLTINYAPSVKTEADKDEVLKAVLAVLGSSKSKRDTNFSYTKTPRGIKIILVPKHGSDKLTAGKLLDVKAALDLTDKQVDAIKFALQH